MAGVMYIGVLVVVINVAVDLAYAWIDPRVRLR
jgi:ABC-type dipeptide/oligopeptide/nickel transport system permease component